MEWKTLLSEKRMRGSGKKQNAKKSDFRSEFEKDYHRIIGSASFRRLQDKTQVFPLDQSDFVRTRLTHSLEVSSLAKSLGQNIGEAILERGADQKFTRKMKEDISHILECAGADPLISAIRRSGISGSWRSGTGFLRKLPELHYKRQTLDMILSTADERGLLSF